MKYESYEQFLSTIPENQQLMLGEEYLKVLFKEEEDNFELDRVRKQLSEAIEVIKFYSDYNNWNHNEMTKTEDLEQFIEENQCDFGATEYLLRDEVGGLKARDFLKSLEEA